MLYTGVTFFVLAILLVCAERAITQYNRHGWSILSIGPWVVLALMTMYIAYEIDILTIADRSVIELQASWKTLSWNISQALQ